MKTAGHITDEFEGKRTFLNGCLFIIRKILALIFIKVIKGKSIVLYVLFLYFFKSHHCSLSD